MRSFTFLQLAVLAGCGSGAVQNNAQAPAPGQTDLSAQPVKEEHRSLELTPAWLAGRWQDGEGNCGAGDTFFTLEPDGRYAFMEEQGRWTLQGNQLTIEVVQPSSDSGTKAGDRNTTEVRPIGPNEAEFRTAGQPPIRVYRCTSGG